jgi:hypothetical protein
MGGDFTHGRPSDPLTDSADTGPTYWDNSFDQQSLTSRRVGCPWVRFVAGDLVSGLRDLARLERVVWFWFQIACGLRSEGSRRGGVRETGAAGKCWWVGRWMGRGEVNWRSRRTPVHPSSLMRRLRVGPVFRDLPTRGSRDYDAAVRHVEARAFGSAHPTTVGLTQRRKFYRPFNLACSFRTAALVGFALPR